MIIVVTGAKSLNPGRSITKSPGSRPNGSFESQGHNTPAASISRPAPMRKRCKRWFSQKLLNTRTRCR